MKKVLIFLALVVIVIGVVFFKNNKTKAPVVENTNQVISNEIHCAISVVSPTPGSTVSFPVELKVIVDNSHAPECRWTTFEAQAGLVELSDTNGPLVLSGIPTLKAQSDWMTSAPVTYTTMLTPTTTPVGTVTIKIKEEDVKGDGNSQTASYTVIAQ